MCPSSSSFPFNSAMALLYLFQQYPRFLQFSDLVPKLLQHHLLVKLPSKLLSHNHAASVTCVPCCIIFCLSCSRCLVHPILKNKCPEEIFLLGWWDIILNLKNFVPPIPKVLRVLLFPTSDSQQICIKCPIITGFFESDPCRIVSNYNSHVSLKVISVGNSTLIIILPIFQLLSITTVSEDPK